VSDLARQNDDQSGRSGAPQSAAPAIKIGHSGAGSTSAEPSICRGRWHLT
jgi:hypothetical protein